MTIELTSSLKISENTPLTLQSIAAGVDLVLLADQNAQSRLQTLVDEWPPPHMEVRDPKDFLHNDDMMSLAGEARRRELEVLFAGLRGKLIVRLVVANLNPEAIVQAGGKCPLASTLADWRSIHLRQKQLLAERSHEGMIFVTIVIAEEGDWRQEHMTVLRSLASGHADDYNLPGRCYLMSRKLELGSNNVLHARDLWPFYVRSLLHHLVNQKKSGSLEYASDSGLYGWRSLIINADPGDGAVAFQFAHALQMLLKSGSDAQISLSSDQKFTLSGIELSIPHPVVKNPFEPNIWDQLPVYTEIERFFNKKTWISMAVADWRGNASKPGVNASVFRHVADGAGKLSAWAEKLWGQIHAAPINTSIAAPSCSLEFGSANIKQLDNIATKAEKAVKESSDLLDWYAQHQQALLYFLSPGKRLVVLSALLLAFIYSTGVFAVAVKKVIGLSWFEAFIATLGISGMTLAGMLAMLLLSYWLQKRAAKVAYQKLREGSQQLEKDYAEIENLKSDLIANAQMSHRALQIYLHARALHIRSLENLRQVRQTLESQGIDKAIFSRQSSLIDREKPWRAQIQLLIKGDTVRHSVKDEKLGFFVRQSLDTWVSSIPWGKLTTSAQHCGFVPAASLKQFLKNFQGTLLDQVKSELLVSTKDNISKNITEDESYRSHVSGLINQHDFFSQEHSQRPNLFSVDVETGAIESRCWTEGSFSKVLTKDKNELLEPTPESPLPPGTLAVVFSEARLHFDKSDLSGDILKFGINAQG